MENNLVLNNFEKEVLIACTTKESGYEEYEGRCFHMQDVKVEGLTRNQIKGYLSQLVQKRLLNKHDTYFTGSITKKGYELLLSLGVVFP